MKTTILPRGTSRSLRLCSTSSIMKDKLHSLPFSIGQEYVISNYKGDSMPIVLLAVLVILFIVMTVNIYLSTLLMSYHKALKSKFTPAPFVMFIPDNEIGIMGFSPLYKYYGCGHMGPSWYQLRVYGTEMPETEDAQHCADCAIQSLKNN